MREWIEERRDVDGLSLNWMTSRTDSSSTPILFLHGVLRRWQDFTPLYAGLSSRWPVCGLDFPGHGGSDRSPDRYLVTDYIAAATAFMESQRPQPNFVLYGHSLGAMVAAGVAANLGGRILAVILEDPPWDTMGKRIGETPLRSYFAAVRTLIHHSSFRSVPLAEQAWRLANVVTVDPLTGQATRLGDVRDAAAIRFFASCLARVDPAALDPIVAGDWLAGYDWLSVAGRIAQPVLLLQADPTAGGMLTDADASAFAAAAGDVSLVKLRGSGHNLHVGRTQDVLNLVSQFLDSHA